MCGGKGGGEVALELPLDFPLLTHLIEELLSNWILTGLLSNTNHTRGTKQTRGSHIQSVSTQLWFNSPTLSLPFSSKSTFCDVILHTVAGEIVPVVVCRFHTGF